MASEYEAHYCHPLYTYKCRGDGDSSILVHRILVCSDGNTNTKKLVGVCFVFFLMLLASNRVKLDTKFCWTPLFIGFLYIMWTRNMVQEETVTLMPTLGIQLETVFKRGKVQRRFVPMQEILAALINECVSPTSCSVCLVLLVRQDVKLVPVFQVRFAEHKELSKYCSKYHKLI